MIWFESDGFLRLNTPTEVFALPTFSLAHKPSFISPVTSTFLGIVGPRFLPLCRLFSLFIVLGFGGVFIGDSSLRSYSPSLLSSTVGKWISP